MAPEVFDEHTCLESDIWSLGITAIELAEGKHPYESHSIMRIMKRISTEAPPSSPPRAGRRTSWTLSASA